MSSRTSSLSTLTTVPFDDVAVLELDDGAGDGVLERHAAEVVVDDLAGDVARRREGAHADGASVGGVAGRQRSATVGVEVGHRRDGFAFGSGRSEDVDGRTAADAARTGPARRLPRRSRPPVRPALSGRSGRPAGDDQELGVVEVGRVGGRSPGRHRPELLDLQRRPRAASRRSSRGVNRWSTGRRSASSPSSSRTVVRSWFTPGVGVEGVAVLEAAHLEVGGEGADAPAGRPGAAPGPCRRARRRRGRRRLAGRRGPGRRPGRTRPGTARSRRRTRRRSGSVAGVEPLEAWRPAAAPSAGQVDEPLADVDARPPRCPARPGPGVAARAAAHVEHPRARARGRARRPGSRPPARCPW